MKGHGEDQTAQNGCKRRLRTTALWLPTPGLPGMAAASRKSAPIIPLTEPATITVDSEKAKTWIQNGAQPTDTVRGLLKKAGVL